jgi:PAS domain S-box-containing protein
LKSLEPLREVLLIEDNPGDAVLLREMLREPPPNDTALTHVNCMAAAERHLAAHKTDLILLDLGLPDVGGLEAVRRAHAAAPRVPLVILSGSDDESLAVQALQHGAQDYLVKGQIEARGLLRALHYAAERKIMEDALFVEMERAQVTLNSIGDAVICTDISGGITFLNAVAEEMTGWTREGAIGRPVTEVLRLLDAGSHQTVPSLIEMAIGQNRPVRLRSNCVFIRPDGQEIPIEKCDAPIHDREGQTAGVVIVFRDVTERIEAQRENVESRRIFEDLFDNSDAAIIDYDFSGLFRAVQGLERAGVRDLRRYLEDSDERLAQLVDGIRINNANAAALRMFGVLSLHEIGKQTTNIIDTAEAILQGNMHIRQSEYLVAGGTPIQVVYSLRIPRTEEDARRVPIVIMDLSEVKLAEAARQATIAKSEFLSTMSHEIRTPLNGLIGNLELLALTGLDTEQLEIIDDADTAAKALLGLIANILDFSKIEAGKLTTEIGEIDPVALVEEAVDMLQSIGRQKEIFIAATFGPGVPSLARGDGMRVRQILLNLIGNAVKFTDRGGVQISLAARALSQDICELRFDVHDSGRGFDPIGATRLFEPFTQERTLADGPDGTGLGLSICKSLVEAFGGTIGCEGTPGEGATFWFTLPVAVVRPGPPAVRADLASTRVLVIGRDDGATTALEAYFRSRGAAVVRATGRSALAVAVERENGPGPQVDLAVIVQGRSTDDVSDTARRLRAEHVVPLLYRAGSAPRFGLRQGFAAVIPPDGCADYLDRNIRFLIGHTRARDRLAARQAEVISVLGPTIRGTRVLVLEDRQVNQKVIQKQLKKLGADCALAANGVEGLAILGRQDFDLILCDCSMPEMNGYDFTRALRLREAAEAKDRRVPVIALTANAFREDADQCIAAGMDDFISKPVTMDRLAAMLIRWLGPSAPGIAAGPFPRGDGGSGAPAIDLAALGEILGEDEPEMLDEVLGEFLIAAEASLSEVVGAVSGGDPATIKAAAHGATGEARCAAAVPLAELYAELDRTARDGDPILSQHLVARAVAEVRRVEAFIRGRLEPDQA